MSKILFLISYTALNIHAYKENLEGSLKGKIKCSQDIILHWVKTVKKVINFSQLFCMSLKKQTEKVFPFEKSKLSHA